MFFCIAVAIVSAGYGALPKKHIEAESITLTSPDGLYKVEIRAMNGTAGVWVSGEPKGTISTMYSDRREGSVAGVFGEGRKSIDGAIGSRGIPVRPIDAPVVTK